MKALSSSIPIPIRLFFIVDLALAFVYIFNYLIGQPSRPLTAFLDLHRENNLPTWYASVQWFCVAVLQGIFAHRNFSRAQRRSWLLAVFPLIFLAFSLDEVAQIHERLGDASDVFLPNASRTHTVFSRTGIWIFLIGAPFILVFVALVFSIQTYFKGIPGAMHKLLLGMTIMLTGALGIEILDNFVDRTSIYHFLQAFVEELCEMIGGTIILWGSYELLHRYGFTIGFDREKVD